MVSIINFVIIFLLTGPWPGQLPGTEIGDSLPDGYEPSGAVWHTKFDKLFTVWDNGMVTMMDYDGKNLTHWSVSGDLEGICIADTGSDFIYVGLEQPDDGIKEFNIVSGQVTRFFDLTPWMQSVYPNLGLEALTFVPDTTNPEGGLFYAGLQENGKIYVFELPIKSSATDSTATFIDSIYSGWPGISGLHYDAENDVLYVIWSSVQEIRAMSKDGTAIVEWDLPGDTQEGIALWSGEGQGHGQIFIAEDAGEVWRYDFNSVLDVVIVGSGEVNLQPDPTSFYGTYETLTAVPDSGYQFIEWSGDLAGGVNPEILLMDYDKNVTATFEPVGIEEQESTIEPAFSLTVTPNPFKNLTKISFNIGHPNRIENSSYGTGSAERIELNIYDITGRLVKSFRLTPDALRTTQIIWDGCNDIGQSVSSGVYFTILQIGDKEHVKKLVLLK
jgi:hypothetical protein